MTGKPIRIVLDTSAIVAYTRHSTAVGELISELADEDSVAGLPLLCLVEARPAVVSPHLTLHGDVGRAARQ